MAHTLEQREITVGNATVLIKRVYDEYPDYSFLGKWCNFERPTTEDQKLIHHETDRILDHKGYWRNRKGQLQAEPTDEYDRRGVYQYTFHDNGHDKATYAYQDHDRMYAMNDGDWHFLGIVVEIIVNGKDIGFSSLWGIESDSDAEYFKEVEREQVSEAVSEARKWLAKLAS